MAYTLPPNVAPCIEPRDLLSGNHRKVPHVCMTKAKIRSIGFRLIVAAGSTDIGKTKVLLGFLPAGRNRVLFELSTINGTGATVSGALKAGEYLMGGSTRIRVPEHSITATVTLGQMMTSLTKNEGATIAGDKELSRPDWGFKYESLEDIPLYITTSALAAGNEIFGQILFGQE